MEIVIKQLKDLVPYDRNPRDINGAVGKVAESIKAFGFNVPILIDAENVIIAGHTRYEAAKELGISEVPCIIADDMTEDEEKQYRIVDNKTGELSSWDYEKLIMELNEISEVDMSVFEFGKFDEEMPPADLETGLSEGKELDLDAFGNETFANECPYCGFKWNE